MGVWVGRDDNTPIGRKQTGGAAALPIWMAFMDKASGEENISDQHLPKQMPEQDGSYTQFDILGL